MTHLRDNTVQSEWCERVLHRLRAQGYYYEQEFYSETSASEPVINAARLLGQLYVPSGMNARQPVILTQPSSSAPQWHPFNHHAAIGWHNDFTTRARRPQLSLSWIRRGDPYEPQGGAWRVASVAAVIAKLRQTREGRSLVALISRQTEVFGYRDAGDWHPFHIVFGMEGKPSRYGMRFYRRALEEGACLRFGEIPERTREIIVRIEEAADSVGEVLYASTGSLLIVENRLSLHDRLEQQVTGPTECRRQAWLCFVKQLHQQL
jgi:hypothetical protein